MLFWRLGCWVVCLLDIGVLYPEKTIVCDGFFSVSSAHLRPCTPGDLGKTYNTQQRLIWTVISKKLPQKLRFVAATRRSVGPIRDRAQDEVITFGSLVQGKINGPEQLGQPLSQPRLRL
jgi:hypothetical protein